MVYETLSGFQIGLWWYQILALRPDCLPELPFVSDGLLHRGSLRPTDTFSNTMFATGLDARIVSERKPSFALLDCHIRGINLYQ